MEYTVKNLAIFAALVALSACVLPGPIVSDYNGDSVKVVTLSYVSTVPTPETDSEALRICRAGGRVKAEYASTRMDTRTGESTHLYLCLRA